MAKHLGDVADTHFWKCRKVDVLVSQLGGHAFGMHFVNFIKVCNVSPKDTFSFCLKKSNITLNWLPLFVFHVLSEAIPASAPPCHTRTVSPLGIAADTFRPCLKRLFLMDLIRWGTSKMTATLSDPTVKQWDSPPPSGPSGAPRMCRGFTLFVAWSHTTACTLEIHCHGKRKF